MKKLLIILAALAFLPGQCRGLDKRLLSAAGAQALAEEAPDFTLLSASGRRTTLSESRGRVVIIHIWATWCEPCKKEFPLLEKMYGEFKKKGVVFFPIAVDTNTDIKKIDAYAKGLGATFDVYSAEDGDISEEYWTWGVPVTYFVNKKGVIVARALGPRDWNSDGVKTLIQALLDER